MGQEGGSVDPKNLGRRDAQQLAREGEIGKAIDALRELASSGECAPYDLVYLGDLHVRSGQCEDAISRYEEAITAYARLGFHRNAIALCRKILRLDPARLDAHSRMGELYAAEGLVGDSLSSSFVFLERTPEKDRGSEAFRDVLRRVEELAPRRPEYAIRLSEILVEADCTASAAGVLARAAEHAQAAGAAELAADLRSRSIALGPGQAAPRRDEQASVAFAPAGQGGVPGAAGAAAAPAGGESSAADGTAMPDPIHFGELELVSSEEPAETGKVEIDQRTDAADDLADAIPLEDESGDDVAAEGVDELAPADEQGLRLQALRASALSRQGKHHEAIREMRAVLEAPGAQGNEAASLMYLLAVELETVGELDEAQRVLRDAVAMRPGFVEAEDRLAALAKGAA